MKKYHIGLVSTEQFSVGFQEQLLIEGHSISMILLYTGIPITEDSGLALKYPKQFKCVNLGSMYKRTPDLGGPQMRKDVDTLIEQKVDFIFFDYNRPNVIDAADYVRTKHPHVIGPTYFTNQLEFNRTLGKRFAAMCGMGSASHHEFKTLAAAAAFVKKTKKNYLLKGSDDTVFPLNWRDCLDFLEKDYFSFIKGDKCIFLEEELVGHFETSCAAFFNGDFYLPHVLFNREYKGVQPETRGHIFSGESGTMSELVYFNDVPAQIRRVFELAIPSLKKCGYKGYIDFNVMLDTETGIYKFLEWTCRPGVPTEVTIAAIYGKDKLYGALRAGSAGIEVDLKTPKLPQAVTIPLMHYSPGIAAKTAAQIMPLIHGLDTDKEGFLKSRKGHVKVMLQDANYTKTKKGFEVRCWGSHDRPVVFVGLHNHIAAGVDMTYSILREHKVGAWAHTYRDDIGADLVAQGGVSLLGFIEDCPGTPLLTPSAQTVRGDATKITTHQFTEAVFQRTLPMEMNSSDVTQDALDQYHNYGKNDQCLIIEHVKKKLDLGFLVWSINHNTGTAYIENMATLIERKGYGSQLVKRFVQQNKGRWRLRLQCHPTLFAFYTKHGFQPYGKATTERIYMEYKA